MPDGAAERLPEAGQPQVVPIAGIGDQYDIGSRQFFPDESPGGIRLGRMRFNGPNPLRESRQRPRTAASMASPNKILIMKLPAYLKSCLINAWS